MTKTTETRAEPPLSLSVQKRQHVQRGGKMSDFDHKAASEKLADPAPAQPMTDEQFYYEMLAQEKEAASQPVEDTPRCPTCKSDRKSIRRTVSGRVCTAKWHEYFGPCPKCGELLGFGHLPENCGAALSSVEDSALHKKVHLEHAAYTSLLTRGDTYEDEDWERASKFERHAINAALDLRDSRAELARAKDALTYLQRDLDVAVKEKLRVERLLSEARKESK